MPAEMPAEFLVQLFLDFSRMLLFTFKQCAEVFDFYFNNPLTAPTTVANNNNQTHAVNHTYVVTGTMPTSKKRNSSDADLDEIIGLSTSKTPKLSKLKKRFECI